MELDGNCIKITDETIVSYYKENTNLDIVTMNHIFIEILKSLSSNLSDTINTSISSKVLSMVTDIHSNLNSVKSDIIIRFHESKKEYIEEIKNIMNSSILTNNEKINTFMEKSNDLLLTKTTLIINDIVPKSQEKNYVQIENCIKSFSSSIMQDTTKLLELSNKDNNQNDAIMQNIDLQLSKMITTIQQPIFSFIQSSEERTNSGIQQIKDSFTMQQTMQQKLTGELCEFLNKYKNNSSSKGNVSEAELYYILQSIMPSDEIIKVGNDTATCDLRVNRMDKTKPSILFENKDYGRSVTTDEVKKFERDIQTQKIHGVFVSQKSPITFKNDFQIDIINGLIHIYIPNADYNISKIKIAIDIIDSLSFKLLSLNCDNDESEYTISKEDMEEISEEYRVFISQKMQMMDTIKMVTKQLVDKLEDIQLPKLKKMFVRFGNIENDNDFKCSLCNCWSGKNKASLAAHIRNCKSNPKNKETLEVIIEEKLNIVIEQPDNLVIQTNILETEPKAKSEKIKKVKSKLSS